MRRTLAAAVLLPVLAGPVCAARADEVVPLPSATERRAVGPTILLERVELEGPSLLTTDDVEGVTRAFTGRMVNGADLRRMASALTERLEARGYMGSRVVLADQEVAGGAIKLRLVAARVVAVNVSPPSFWNREVALRAWVLPHGDELLHLPTLQDRLAQLRESGLVQRVHAEVVAFDERGAAYAVALEVEESHPFRVIASYANNRASSIGARRAELALFDQSVLGLGDAFEGRVGRTRGLDDSYLGYRLPIPRTPIAFFASRTRSDSLAIDPPAFRELGITALGDTDSVGVEWQLARTMPFAAVARYAFDRRTTRSELLGIPFSFIPGVVGDEGRARVHRLAVEAVQRREAWSISGRLQYSRGTTNSQAEGDIPVSAPSFQAWSFSLTGVRELGAPWGQWRARLEGQATRDRLFPFEKVALGGAGTVRGYRENAYLFDRGALASLEWRAPELSFWRDNVRVGPGVFVDGGWGRDMGGGSVTLASIGVSLRVEVLKHLAIQVAWARPRQGYEGERRDLQDRGVHYAVSVSWP